ncbi:hypothetical protein [Kineococcus terrestris]|uniref:hypothetical protein n=1 Tax=Kineococcus terrestris TaxID=2044856 RepID=UPI0034DADB95
MPTRKRSTHQRGLGWQHQQQRAALLRAHIDGTPCPCTDCGPACPCRAAGRPPGLGLPMWRDPASNVDRRPLDADHTLSRAHGGTVADRLVLSTCNRSRGDGSRSQGRDGTGAPSVAAPRRAYWSRQW